MGKKSKEIAGAGVDGTIAMLKKAYGGEASAFQYFWYIAQNVEGLGVLESKFFEQRADEELVIQRKSHLDLCNWEKHRPMIRLSGNKIVVWGSFSLQGFLPLEVHLKEH